MEERTNPWRQAFPAILGMLLLMVRSGAARAGALQGIQLSAEVVVPSLFPFFVLSRRLTQSGILRFQRGNRLCRRLFGVQAAGMGAFLMGFCGGYPLGVAAACQLYRNGQLSKDEVQRLLVFVNNTGPAFFFGMVGAVLFPNVKVCAVLYLIHILSAVLAGLLMQQPGAESDNLSFESPALSHETLPESIRQAFFSVCQLCGYVVFFSAVLGMVPGFGNDIFRAILCAAVDLPNGIAAIARIGDPVLRFFLCAGAIGWGGFCVHMQAAGLWQQADLEPRGYFRGKLCHAAVSCALAFPFARLIFGGGIPIWPGLLPVLAVFLKRTVAFFPDLGYNTKNTWKRRPPHALSQENRTRLCLLRPGGKNR